MSKKRKSRRKKKKGNKGNGNGCHHETSPMGHSTLTRSRRDEQNREDRRHRQKGWE